MFIFLRVIVVAVYLVGFGWIADLNYSLRPLNVLERFENSVVDQMAASTGLSRKEVGNIIIRSRSGRLDDPSLSLLVEGRYYDSVKVQILVGERVLSADFGDNPIFGIKFLQSFIFFFIGLFGSITVSLKGDDDNVDKEKIGS